MKMCKLLLAAFLAIAPTVAFAQAPAGGAAPQAAQAQAGWDKAAPMTVAVQAPPATGGGVINIGQAFGTIAQPYIDAAVQALLASAVGWVLYLVQKYLGIKATEGQRATLTTYLQNTASSLIADGAVKMQGKTVTVNSTALAAEANTAINRIPDALKQFGLDTPGAISILKEKIIDAIPQVPAGAAMVAQASSSPAAAAAAPIEPAVVVGSNAELHPEAPAPEAKSQPTTAAMLSAAANKNPPAV